MDLILTITANQKHYKMAYVCCQQIVKIMPREPLPLKREHKGDVTINIADIFRNEEMQKEAIKGCKKLKPRKRK